MMLLQPLLMCLTFCLLQFPPQTDAVRYSGNGISFDYPSSWKLNAQRQADIVSLTIQNDKGSGAIVQLHPPESNPIALRGQLERSFKQSFKARIVEASHKKVTTTFLGGQRDGVGMDFDFGAKNILHQELFSFPLPSTKRVLCLVLQHNPQDARAASGGFGLIAQSFAELDAKGKRIERMTPNHAPVRLNSPPPFGWSLIQARPGVKIWTDRDYALTKLPREVEDAALVQRPFAQGKNWIMPGQLTVHADGIAYVMARSKYLGVAQLDDSLFRLLAADGWSEVKTPVETTFPRNEGWGWRLIKREMKQGEDLSRWRNLFFDQPYVVAFKQ